MSRFSSNPLADVTAAGWAFAFGERHLLAQGFRHRQDIGEQDAASKPKRRTG
jgi:hypothetical protein